MVVAYASKALSARQKKFSATEKEAYAIVFGTQQFRVYLLGRHFQIVTDHNACVGFIVWSQKVV
jgi:phospholipid-translocating ATPase